MKKKLLFVILLVAMISTNSISQSWYLNQLIIGSGGNFSDPDDYVTLASYNPSNQVTTVFDTIYTQSLQDVFVKDGKAWVAAQDSIVSYNLDTYERISAIGAPGVNKLKITGDRLIASFWYPATSGFVKSYSATDLTEINVFDEVSDEAAGIHIMIEEQTAIVAVPGSWMSTSGKVAWIDLEDNTVMGESDFQSDGMGINFFVEYEAPVPSFGAVTVTPWGDSTFNFLGFNAEGQPTGNYSFDGVMGGFTGISGNLLYAKINGGIGVLNLEAMELMTDLIIEQGLLSMAGTCLDTIDQHIYIASTDYFSTGAGTIYNTDGELIGGFEAGISPESVALDYRISSSLMENENLELTVYPNPVSETLNIKTKIADCQLLIYDLSGRILVNEKIFSEHTKINIDFLEKGIYSLTLVGESATSSTSFIVH